MSKLTHLVLLSVVVASSVGDWGSSPALATDFDAFPVYIRTESDSVRPYLPIAVWTSVFFDDGDTQDPNNVMYVTGNTPFDLNGGEHFGTIQVWREEPANSFNFVLWDTLGGGRCAGGAGSGVDCENHNWGQNKGPDCGETGTSLVVSPDDDYLLMTTEARPNGRSWSYSATNGLVKHPLKDSGCPNLHWGLVAAVDRDDDEVLYVHSGASNHTFPGGAPNQRNNNALYLVGSAPWEPDTVATDRYKLNDRMVAFRATKHSDGKWYVAGGRNTNLPPAPAIARQPSTPTG